MCEKCSMESDGKWNEISDRFVFEEGQLDYYDSPLAGHMRCRICDTRFVFRTTSIILDRLWHWSLVITDEGSLDSVEEAYVKVKSVDGTWQSILEDRRSTNHSICTGVAMAVKEVAPPAI